jgi:hypothetical protein
MKKSQLKQLLKPIIKECINEALIEQGLLSNIISEVIKGLQPMQTIVEAKQPVVPQVNQKEIDTKRNEMLEEQQRALKEQKRKLLNATGFGSYIFEGTQPMSTTGKESQHSALTGTDPGDAGVDLTGIMGLAGRNWKELV